jgi:hypothetical protein
MVDCVGVGDAESHLNIADALQADHLGLAGDPTRRLDPASTA